MHIPVNLNTPRSEATLLKSKSKSIQIPNIGQVSLFFSRFHGNKKWVALVTTELDISYIKAIARYAIR